MYNTKEVYTDWFGECTEVVFGLLGLSQFWLISISIACRFAGKFSRENREEISIDVINPSLFLEGRFGVHSAGQNLGSQRFVSGNFNLRCTRDKKGRKL